MNGWVSGAVESGTKSAFTTANLPCLVSTLSKEGICSFIHQSKNIQHWSAQYLTPSLLSRLAIKLKAGCGCELGRSFADTANSTGRARVWEVYRLGLADAVLIGHKVGMMLMLSLRVTIEFPPNYASRQSSITAHTTKLLLRGCTYFVCEWGDYLKRWNHWSCNFLV